MKLSVISRYSIAAICFGLGQIASAADLTVEVGGASSNQGQIGCALFSKADGFPLKHTDTQQVWHPIKGSQAICQFKNLPAGVYAVAASHDENKNKKADTNAFGLPNEAWGVSNNIRPRLRAPRFEEAAFNLPAAGSFRISIGLDK